MRGPVARLGFFIENSSRTAEENGFKSIPIQMADRIKGISLGATQFQLGNDVRYAEFLQRRDTGMPMSATCNWPTKRRACWVRRPFLAAAKVTVTRARTAISAAWPVSGSRPDGRSTATIGLPEAFIAAMAS